MNIRNRVEKLETLSADTAVKVHVLLPRAGMSDADLVSEARPSPGDHVLLVKFVTPETKSPSRVN